MSTSPPLLIFAPLPDAALAEFADARTFVARVASDLVQGAVLTQSASDLPVLQALVDHQAMKHANSGAWVAMGIAFGDALADLVPGLAWRLVTDQQGPHAALQLEGKTMSIPAPTMLWKRVERGETIDLANIAHELKTLIDERGHEIGDA